MTESQTDKIKEIVSLLQKAPEKDELIQGGTVLVLEFLERAISEPVLSPDHTHLHHATRECV